MNSDNEIRMYLPLACLFDTTIVALKHLYGDRIRKVLIDDPVKYVTRKGNLKDVASWICQEDVTKYIKDTPNLIEQAPRNSLALFIPLQVLPLIEQKPDLKIYLDLDINGFNLSEEDLLSLKFTLGVEFGSLITLNIINYGEHNFSVADYIKKYTASYLMYPYEWLKLHLSELLLVTVPTTNVIFKQQGYYVDSETIQKAKDQLMADPRGTIEEKENLVNVDWITLTDDEFARGTINFQTLPSPIVTGIIPETEPVIADWFKAIHP